MSREGRTAILILLLGAALGGILFAWGSFRVAPEAQADHILECSSCQIPAFDASVTVTGKGQAEWCAQFPSGDACTRWNDVVNFAKSINFNPALMLALWGEESHFGTVGFSLGITSCAADLDSQMACFQQVLNNCSGFCGSAGTQFCSWAQCWSGGASCTLTNNPNFLHNLYDFYNQMVPAGSPGASSGCDASGTPSPGGSGEECGGGTDTTEGVGPVFNDVASCDACKQIAQCIGGKTGHDDPAYLWDSVTKICGVGIEVDDATAASCKVTDKCLGVSKTKFSEVRQDALDMAQAGKVFFGEEDYAPADLLLSYAYVASKWEQFAGEGTYPTDFCAEDKTAYEGSTLCGSPTLQSQTPTMDVNGDGTADGRSCLAMPVSKDPDGSTGPECGGRIGISQVKPKIFEDNALSIAFMLGTTQPNPWDRRQGIGIAENLMGVSRGNFDLSACANACVAAGGSTTPCVTQCQADEDRCGILEAYYGPGTCTAPSPAQKTFADEVIKFRPVMQSLLDTGKCPGEGTVSCQDLPEGMVGDVDIARFNQLAPIVTEMVQKVKDLYGYVVRPEYVLSVMKIESGWNPTLNPLLRYYYTHAPFNDLLSGQLAAFLAICADPTTRAEVEATYGTEFGSCEGMPTSSSGAMGIAQAMPVTWAGVLAQTNNLKDLTGDTYDNPWNDRHAVAFAAYFLGQKVFGCGNEEMASGAYYSVGCTAPNEHYERVKTVLPTIEALYADACTVPAGDGCPLVNPPFPPTPPTNGCLYLASDFCPLDGSQCSCYGDIDGDGIPNKHRGVDLWGIRGEPVYATFDAAVIHANNNCIEGDSTCGFQWGNHIVLQEDGKSFHVLYAHLMDTTVLTGEHVTKGRVLGHVDNTGLSGGDHLHFESHTSADPRGDRDGVADPRDFFSCIPKTCGATFCPAQ